MASSGSGAKAEGCWVKWFKERWSTVDAHSCWLLSCAHVEHLLSELQDQWLEGSLQCLACFVF